MKYVCIAIVIIVVLGVVWAAVRGRKASPTQGEILPAAEMQEKYGLYAENSEQIEIDPEQVPEHLRDLIPMAKKWGIGDDIIRDDFEEKATEAEKKEFQDILRGRTAEVTAWLDIFKHPKPMPEEAVPFMYMLQALEESGLWPD